MCASNHGMVRLSDQWQLILSLASPEYEHHSRWLRGNQFDHTVGELLPPTPLMRVGLMCPNCKDRVEHKDALPGPTFQIAVIGNPASRIVMEFPIDVSQREGQRPDGRLHGETEAMGMTGGRIGILAHK